VALPERPQERVERRHREQESSGMVIGSVIAPVGGVVALLISVVIVEVGVPWEN
jgi:hypothetical protein